MKNLLKINAKLLVALTLLASVSACAQPGLNQAAAHNFPSYGISTVSSGQFVPPSIMDY